MSLCRRESRTFYVCVKGDVGHFVYVEGSVGHLVLTWKGV